MFTIPGPFFGPSATARYMDYLTQNHPVMHQRFSKISDLENMDPWAWDQLRVLMRQVGTEHPEYYVQPNMDLLQQCQQTHLFYRQIDQQPHVQKILRSCGNTERFEHFSQSFARLKKLTPEALFPIVCIDLMRTRLQLLIDPLKNTLHETQPLYAKHLAQPLLGSKSTASTEQMVDFYHQIKNPDSLLSQSPWALAYPNLDPLRPTIASARFNRQIHGMQLHHGIKILQKCASHAAAADPFFHADVISYIGFCNSADLLHIALEAGMHPSHPTLFGTFNQCHLKHPLLQIAVHLPHHNTLASQVDFARFVQVLITHQPDVLFDSAHPNYMNAQKEAPQNILLLLINSTDTPTNSAFFLVQHLLDLPSSFAPQRNALLHTVMETLEHNGRHRALHAYLQQQHLTQHTPNGNAPKDVPKIRL